MRQKNINLFMSYFFYDITIDEQVLRLVERDTPVVTVALSLKASNPKI